MATIPGSGYVIDSHPNDVIDGSHFGGDMFANLTFAHDTVDTGSGYNEILSHGGHTTVEGGDGTDVIFAYNGHNFIDGGSGNDIITVGGQDNIVHAGSGDNVIYGGTGNDLLIGGAGDDSIHAGTGNEFLSGGEGNNTLFAGKGDDTMIGGPGENTFSFGSGGGKNVVVDFHDGDSLHIAQNINGLAIHTAQDVAAHVSDDNGNAVITLGHETITLLNIKAEDIQNNPTGYFHVH